MDCPAMLDLAARIPMDISTFTFALDIEAIKVTTFKHFFEVANTLACCMTSPSEFERLIQEVSSGSEDAIWKLVETYTPFIIRSVRSTLPSRLRPRLDSQ